MSKMKPTEKDKQSCSIRYATSLLMTRDTIPHAHCIYCPIQYGFFCYGGWDGNYDGVAQAVENANSLKV